MAPLLMKNHDPEAQGISVAFQKLVDGRYDQVPNGADHLLVPLRNVGFDTQDVDRARDFTRIST